MGRAAIFSIAVSGLMAFGQDPEVVFRSDVALVRVDAQVRDRSTSRAITGLNREDFVLREQGKVREIRNFAREEMPMDVLMLLDVSGSMRSHVERIAEAARQAFQALGSNDRVALMVFDRRTKVRMPFRLNRTGDAASELDRLLRDEHFNGGTDITASIRSAIDYVKRNARSDARRAIVIMTDDQTEFERDEAVLVSSLQRNDIVMSLILAPDAMASGRGYPGGVGGVGYPRRGGMGGTWPPIFGPRFPGGRGGGPVILGGRGTKSAGTRTIAEESGGDFMNISDASALEETLLRLRQRYAIYFMLPEGARAGQQRTIQLDLVSATARRYPDYEIRYRRTYIAQDSNTSTPAEVSSSPSEAATAPQLSGTNTDAPVAKPRTRRVSDPGSGAHSGPLVDRTPAADDPPSAPAPRGWPTANEIPAKPPATGPSPGKTEAEKKGGWPRVK